MVDPVGPPEANFNPDGKIDPSGETYTVVFANTTIGAFTTATWDFGQNATPATATSTDRSPQTVTYQMLEEAYSAQVKLTVDSDNGADEITKEVMIPAIAGIEDLPAGAPCSDSFENDPACFCQDPANAGDSRCAVVNTENGDMETDGMPNGTLSADWGAFWEIYGDRQGGEAVFSQISAGGSKVMRVEINSFGGDCDDCPWALQTVTEPDGNDNGWATPSGKDYVVLVDIHASKSGMKVWLPPGQSGAAGYGAIDLNYPVTELQEGWNKVELLVTNAEGRSLNDTGQGVRGEMNFNFEENVGGILHIDNYRLIPVNPADGGGGGDPTPSSLSGSGIDFEDPEYDPDFGPFNDDANFPNGTVSAAVIDNPDPTGINTSSKVGEMTQSADVVSWAGVTIKNLLAEPIDWSKGRIIQMDVWSPAIGQSTNLKLEGATDNSINTELAVSNTKANEWETLSFEFTPEMTDGKDLSKVVLFFNIDGDKSAPTTHYFDNIRQVNESGISNLLETTSGIDFEDPNYDPDLGPFNDDANFPNGVVSAAVIDNPDPTGINTSSKVGEMTQSADVVSWAGVTINTLLENPIDWSKGRKILVDVWSPAAGQSTNLKLEASNDSSINAELAVSNTKANEWETITFEFTPDMTDGKDLTKIVLFFNIGGDKSAPTTHYFDNIRQVE